MQIMEDHEQETGSRSNQGTDVDRRCEPVRSRWTPKPEQILILESIFNGGMVNPPKDETVRIRKLLEKFGTVGDANVFYWFQNRRSRSRRRQRQIQASLNTAAGEQPQPHGAVGGAIHNYQQHTLAEGTGYISPAAMSGYNPIGSSPLVGPGSSLVGLDHGFLSFSGQEVIHHNSFFSDSSNLHFQSGVITVFINGVATEVRRGAFNVRTMFGGDYVLIDSSGVAVEVNEHGFLVQSLQHGHTYFLVPRHS